MSTQAEFDYVVIGAGSAGCVLANKLSASGAFDVLLLEAGPPDRNLMIHIPAGVYSAYRNPKINWNYYAFGCYKHISRVHVSMEKTVTKHLKKKSFR